MCDVILQQFLVPVHMKLSWDCEGAGIQVALKSVKMKKEHISRAWLSVRPDRIGMEQVALDSPICLLSGSKR